MYRVTVVNVRTQKSESTEQDEKRFPLLQPAETYEEAVEKVLEEMEVFKNCPILPIIYRGQGDGQSFEEFADSEFFRVLEIYIGEY